MFAHLFEKLVGLIKINILMILPHRPPTLIQAFRFHRQHCFSAIVTGCIGGIFPDPLTARFLQRKNTHVFVKQMYNKKEIPTGFLIAALHLQILLFIKKWCRARPELQANKIHMQPYQSGARKDITTSCSISCKLIRSVQVIQFGALQPQPDVQLSGWSWKDAVGGGRKAAWSVSAAGHSFLLGSCPAHTWNTTKAQGVTLTELSSFEKATRLGNANCRGGELEGPTWSSQPTASEDSLVWQYVSEGSKLITTLRKKKG